MDISARNALTPGNPNVAASAVPGTLDPSVWALPLHRQPIVEEEHPLADRVAELIRREVRPICASCVGELLGVPHLTARNALDSLAMADAFSYRQRCGRCGGGDTVVGLRAA
jgi:hypothetical protein